MRTTLIPYALASLLVGCTPDETRPITEIGNPERRIGVAALAPTPPTGGTTSDVVIEEAWASLGEIKLQLDPESAVDHELEWETPAVTSDLAGGPVEVVFRSPIAGYDLVTLRPREGRDLPAAAPEELRDYSFVVRGTRGDGVPFLLRSTTREDIVLAGAFELGEEQTELALGFDLERWLDPVVLASATVVGGVIPIDESDNTDLLQAFEAVLSSTVSLAEDLDGDGQVGDVDRVLLD